MIFPTELFTRRSLYTEGFLHTDAFAHRSFYTEKPLHRGAFTHKSIYTHRGFYTEKSLHKGAFYTEKSLLQGAFAHKRLGAFTHRSCYTKKSLHRYIAFTHRRVYTEAFTQRSLYTLHREFLHTEAFTHSEIFTQTFHTEKLSHISFYTKKSLHKVVFTHRNFYTQKLLHREVFAQRRLDMKSQVEIGSSSSGKTLGRSFRALTCSPKKPSISNKVPIPWFFFKKRKEYMSEAGPHPKAFHPPHCDEMEGREIRRSRRGALALNMIYFENSPHCMLCYLFNWFFQGHGYLDLDLLGLQSLWQTIEFPTC